MTKGRKLTTVTFAILAVLMWLGAKADAAQCGSSGDQAQQIQNRPRPRGAALFVSCDCPMIVTLPVPMKTAAPKFPPPEPPVPPAPPVPPFPALLAMMSPPFPPLPPAAPKMIFPEIREWFVMLMVPPKA